MELSRPSFLQLIAFFALLPLAALWTLSVSLVTAGAMPTATAEHVQEEQSSAVVFPLPDVAQYEIKKTIRLTVTAYSSTVDQTDGDPWTTASGATVRDGIIAHNVLPFGTRVRFPDVFGEKVFIVQDRLSPRKGYYIADIWMPTREQAKAWGAPILKMEVLGS